MELHKGNKVETLTSLVEEINRHPNRFLIMYDDERSGGIWIAGDQAKLAEGLVNTLKAQPHFQEWLAMVLKMASKK